jgi:hypothetical protein
MVRVIQYWVVSAISLQALIAAQTQQPSKTCHSAAIILEGSQTLQGGV